MSLDADLIVDRRRMRRKLTFWRVVAVWSRSSPWSALAGVARRGSGILTGGRRYDRPGHTSKGLIRGDRNGSRRSTGSPDRAPRR